MTDTYLPVDRALLSQWKPWVVQSTKRFGASGYGDAARCYTPDQITSLVEAPSTFHARAVRTGSGARGMLLASDALWESGVIERPVAKVSWFAADDFQAASLLAASVIGSARDRGVVLLSASPGHSPSYVHVALTEAGFHIGSQNLTVRADLEAIAPVVARIPKRGLFREATAADADAIAALARDGFIDARFTGDPFFPREWGQALFAAWARNLVLGGADSVVVAESEGSLMGFVSMTLDEGRRAAVPALLAIDPRYNGWGIGAMLVRVMLDWYRERGVKILIGGTEKSNTPINALYVKLGISFVDSNIVYHATPALSGVRGAPASSQE